MSDRHQFPERRGTGSVVIGTPSRDGIDCHRNRGSGRPNSRIASLPLAQPKHDQDSATENEGLPPENDEPTPSTASFPWEEDSRLWNYA
jgi:hypothetical protein